ncbi:RUS1 family protein C16orf58 homolog isoform X3 [Heterodontus francisci]|uniref:RUS1 family protein C16orf58 homolog isoform X3 n=1 Tax=Heterodontus francisci TaxID=7792 RepID=UPI00355B1492
MAEKATGVLCSERYSTRRAWRYVQLEGGELVRRAEQAERVSRSVAVWFTSVFLPQGYPDSVSDDYLTYQIWDTVQAFASSITGTLATQAILKGVGVGDNTATVAGASITWILKDGTGMVGRILFAWMKGSRLDCDAKKWSPLSGWLEERHGQPSPFTRPGVTTWPTFRQRTAASLTYLLYALFTSLHLYANYRAVSSVVMETLNQARFKLMVNDYLLTGSVPPPISINPRESLLPAFQRRLSVRLGASLDCILHSSLEYQKATKNNSKSYLLGLYRNTGVLCISLRDGVSSVDVIEACFHAEILQQLLHQDVSTFRLERDTFTKLQEKVLSARDDRLWDAVAETHLLVDRLFPRLLSEARSVGWVVERNQLAPDEWRAQWPLEGKKRQ